MAKRSKCQRSCDLVLSEDVDHLYTTWVLGCGKVSDIWDVSDGCDQKRFLWWILVLMYLEVCRSFKSKWWCHRADEGMVMSFTVGMFLLLFSKPDKHNTTYKTATYYNKRWHDVTDITHMIAYTYPTSCLASSYHPSMNLVIRNSMGQGPKPWLLQYIGDEILPS